MNVTLVVTCLCQIVYMYIIIIRYIYCTKQITTLEMKWPQMGVSCWCAAHRSNLRLFLNSVVTFMPPHLGKMFNIGHDKKKATCKSQDVMEQ